MDRSWERRTDDRFHGRIPQAGTLLRVAPIPAPRFGVLPFWQQPEGLARVFAQGGVALLDHIPDMLVVALLALSENRDSASRVSLC